MNRLSSIDIARGLAIFLMIFIESADYTSGYSSFFYKDIHVSMLVLIGPLLFMVSGTSLFFWFHHIDKKPKAFLKVLKRCLILLVALWFIYFITGQSYNWQSWELLPALGVFSFLLWFIHKYLGNFTSNTYLLSSLALFIATVIAQYLLNVQGFWEQDYKFFQGLEAYNIRENTHPLAFKFYTLLIYGYYPILPYFAYTLMGYWIGKVIKDDQKSPDKNLKRNIYTLCVSLTVCGFLLLGINQYFLNGSWWLRYAHFPSRLPTELIYAGTNTLLIFALYFYYDRGKRALDRIGNIFYAIGQNAIYIYMLGVLSIYLVVKLGGFFLSAEGSITLDYITTLPEFWLDHSSMKYYRGLVSIPQGFLIGFIINVVLYLVFSKKRYQPGEKLGEHGKRKIL